MVRELFVVAALAYSSSAYNNGMGKKPPMGWQTWCSVGPCGTDHCFDGQIREMADTLVANGMKTVIDYVHSKGLKFGLYTSVGDKTCHGGWSPGSYGHYEEDANLFAAWEVDYVKMDYCGDFDSPEGHKEMSQALNKTGRHMSYMLCRGPYQKEDKWGYAPSIAQGWRATGDHHDSFDSTLQQVNAVKGK